MMDIATQLYRDEGVKYSVYQDQFGYWTLGVGFLVDARKGGKIPDPVLKFWLEYIIDDRRRALRSALPWFDHLDEPRKGVLLNMAYQLGAAGLLAFTTTLARVRDGRYEDAATAMLQSEWAKQTPERARRLSIQMASGAWQ